jgi:dolichol-phosphate mannosyltransferase
LTNILLISGVKFEIVVVDDNSPDKTQEVIHEMQKVFGEEKIKLLARSGKLGLGSAYIDGSKLCQGDFIIIMDADFSHHVKLK